MAQQTIDHDWLAELCRRTDDILWAGYRYSQGASDAPWPRVLFPLKGHEPRVGEHEARVAFIAALLADPAGAPWAFAAEAPTRLSYRFAGRAAGPRAHRALTDLALYRDDPDTPALAVEFKSGGRSGRSEQDENIRKDMAKVLAEQPAALWFHLVRDASETTLQGLLRTLDTAISQLSNPYKLAAYLASGKTYEPRAKQIAFHVCLLSAGAMVSVHRVLDYVPGKPKDEFFTLDTTFGGEAAATGSEATGSEATGADAAGGEAAPGGAAAVAIADGQGWSVYRTSA
jgi:hypothetical protein